MGAIGGKKGDEIGIPAEPFSIRQTPANINREKLKFECEPKGKFAHANLAHNDLYT